MDRTANPGIRVLWEQEYDRDTRREIVEAIKAQNPIEELKLAMRKREELAIQKKIRDNQKTKDCR